MALVLISGCAPLSVLPGPETRASLIEHGTGLARGAIVFSGQCPDGSETGNVAIHKGALSLISSDREGYFISPVQDIPESDWLVPSWTATVPASSSLEVYVQVRAGQTWSGWFPFGIWSERPRSASTENAFGKVDVDTLLLKETTKQVRFKLLLRPSASKTSQPAVERLNWVVRNRQARRKADPSLLAAIPNLELSVPARSQRVEDPAIANRICSPTSISMALAYAGIDIPTARVAWGVYDHGADLFGNWAFNVAYLRNHGLKGRVDWFPSLGNVATELQKGNLVIASVGFQEGGLPGSPLKATQGHLLLIRGFQHKEGGLHVVCNDPAAPDTGTVRREYPADSFSKAWKGVVYVVENQRVQ